VKRGAGFTARRNEANRSAVPLHAPRREVCPPVSTSDVVEPAGLAGRPVVVVVVDMGAVVTAVVLEVTGALLAADVVVTGSSTTPVSRFCFAITLSWGDRAPEVCGEAVITTVIVEAAVAGAATAVAVTAVAVGTVAIGADLARAPVVPPVGALVVALVIVGAMVVGTVAIATVRPEPGDPPCGRGPAPHPVGRTVVKATAMSKTTPRIDARSMRPRPSLRVRWFSTDTP
jgi:hypothetical protein